jgi:hypothetical protein
LPLFVNKITKNWSKQFILTGLAKNCHNGTGIVRQLQRHGGGDKLVKAGPKEQGQATRAKNIKADGYKNEETRLK